MRAPVALLCATLLASIACDRRVASEPGLPIHRWVTVYDDARYRVSFDTAHVRRDGHGVYLTWIETRHATVEHEAGQAFNREVIRNFLRCDPLSFRNVSVQLSLDDGPVVVWQGGDVRTATTKRWRATIPGSVDEGAMSRQCRLLGEIARR